MHSRLNWNLEVLVSSWSKGENQQQTQPTYGINAMIQTRATLMGGEYSHHCATLAPRLKHPKFKVFDAYIVITTNNIIIFYCLIISCLVWLTHNAKNVRGKQVCI